VILELRTLMLANSKELARTGNRIKSRVNEQIRQAQARVRASVQEELDRHETARRVALGLLPRPTRPKQRKGAPYDPLKDFHYDLLSEWMDYYEERSARVRELAELSTPQAYARMLEEQLNARGSKDRAERALYRQIVANTETELNVEARAERIAIPGNFLARHIHQIAGQPMRSPRLNDWREIALLALAACDFGTPFKRLCIDLEVNDSRAGAPVRELRDALNHRTAILAAADLDDGGGKEFLREGRRKAWWRKVQQAHLHLSAAASASNAGREAPRTDQRGARAGSRARANVTKDDPRRSLRGHHPVYRAILRTVVEESKKTGKPIVKRWLLQSLVGDLMRLKCIRHQVADLNRCGYLRRTRGQGGGSRITPKGLLELARVD